MSPPRKSPALQAYPPPKKTKRRLPICDGELLRTDGVVLRCKLFGRRHKPFHSKLIRFGKLGSLQSVMYLWSGKGRVLEKPFIDFLRERNGG